MIAASVGTHDVLSVRRSRQPAGVQPGDYFFDDAARAKIDHTYGPFAGDVSHGVDANFGAASGWAGHIAEARTPAAPVAYVSFVADEYHVVRGHADVELIERFARLGIKFQEPVRQVAANIESLRFRRDCQTGWNFSSAARGVRGG